MFFSFWRFHEHYSFVCDLCICIHESCFSRNLWRLRSREMIVVGFLFLFLISPASSSSQLTTRALSWIVHLLPKRIVRNSDLFCVLFLFGTFMNTFVSVWSSYLQPQVLFRRILWRFCREMIVVWFVFLFFSRSTLEHCRGLCICYRCELQEGICVSYLDGEREFPFLSDRIFKIRSSR